MLREELQLLQEQGSYVGEIVKAMDKKKVLVKVYLFQIIILSNYLLLREFFVSK
jgi:ATP-dependent 26S proteasome regulatory subunit